jgi:K+ transporter
MPRWLCRAISVAATLIVVFAVLVGDRVIAARLSKGHHGEVASFVVAILILVIVIWKLGATAVRAGRFGWSWGEDGKNTRRSR